MSAWGYGIKQSDEFMDVYDEFLESYIDDADAIEIYRSILNEYQREFSDADSGPLLYRFIMRWRSAFGSAALKMNGCGKKSRI